MKKVVYGIILGITYIIPGLCSASMAISLGVYNDLLDLFANFYKLKTIKKYWEFIIGMISGAVLSFVLLMFVYEKYPYLFLSFFIGFIWSNYKSYKGNKKYKWYEYLLIALIILFVFSINTIGNFRVISFEENVNLFVVCLIFLVGVLSSFALILPGISGAMILFVFGIYDLILKTFQDIIYNIKTFQPPTGGKLIIILPFIVGLIGGILAFSKIIDKISKSKPRLFLLVTKGFILGSLTIILCDLAKNIVTIPIFVISSILIILGYFLGNKLIKRSKSQ